ncbi:AF4/FMR2 family member 4-like, partial [Salarias fasciatus]|uniref:AF4/FMR2 family member 4-like n=1 Tax=Salarias fasciatus TaxID=181472 RepID=UPI001176C676
VVSTVPCAQQKPPKTNPAAPSPSQPTSHALTNRPLLRPEERRYPVKHYIKEAKRLKHRADAEPDKLRKAFSYLEAAMFFVESGIAMEKDPQISTSSYTMFAETVELLKFVLKLKSSGESSSSPSEKDFLSLCVLSELDAVLGPLSLSSAMSSMVRYTRQGLHWLRLDSHRG